MRLVITLLVVTAAGCAVPGAVNGVVQDQDFSVQCPAPLAKTTDSDQTLLVVLSQHDDKILRTVTLSMPHWEDLAVNDEQDVPSDNVGVEAVVGDLVEEDIGDGRSILYHANPVESVATKGRLTLTSKNDVVSGTFAVDLDDGGYLDGSFAVDTDDIAH